MNFTGHIDSFKSVWFNEHTALLPRVAVNVSDGQTSLLLTGWLPFHHRSVTYVLRITTPRQGKARILEVVSVTRKDLKDSSSIPSTFTKMKRVARLSEFAYKEYIARTKAAYASGPLWRLCTLYSYWRLKDMDLMAADAAIAARLLTLCDRESLWCHRDVMYHTGRARRLLQKGAAVYNMPFDVQAFDTLMDWQRATMTDTAVRVRPEHSPEGLQCYQGKWTSSAEIARAKTIGQAFAHANALLGSPCPSNIPEDAIVWVRCLEDAYRWKCWVDWGRLCLLELPGPELRPLRVDGRATYQTGYRASVYRMGAFVGRRRMVCGRPICREASRHLYWTPRPMATRPRPSVSRPNHGAAYTHLPPRL